MAKVTLLNQAARLDKEVLQSQQSSDLEYRDLLVSSE